VIVILVPGHSGPREVGAALEREWCGQLCDKIYHRLDDAGVASVTCQSWLNTAVPALVKAPERAMLVAHYDGAIPGATGYWGDISRRHHDSPSLLLLAAWESTYAALGLPYTPHRRTRNTGWFYGWQGAHLATPRIIVEHGFGAGEDHDLLHDNIERVADLDADAILLFLGKSSGSLGGLRAELATAASERGQLRNELGDVASERDQLRNELGAAFDLKMAMQEMLKRLIVNPGYKPQAEAWYHQAVTLNRWSEMRDQDILVP